MYRDDDAARDARANALISEIAELERHKIARAEQDQRLATARDELATLLAPVTPPAPPEPRAPGVLVHIAVFAVAACATFAGYTLLL